MRDGNLRNQQLKFNQIEIELQLMSLYIIHITSILLEREGVLFCLVLEWSFRYGVMGYSVSILTSSPPPPSLFDRFGILCLRKSIDVSVPFLGNSPIIFYQTCQIIPEIAWVKGWVLNKCHYMFFFGNYGDMELRYVFGVSHSFGEGQVWD